MTKHKLERHSWSQTLLLDLKRELVFQVFDLSSIVSLSVGITKKCQGKKQNK